VAIVSFKNTLVNEFYPRRDPPEMRVENPLLAHLAAEISQTGTQF
jgi:hypothetical protein